jgi:hypothetical protein
VRRPRPQEQHELVQRSLTELFEMNAVHRVVPDIQPIGEVVTSASYCKVCIVIYSLWFTIAAGSFPVGTWRSYAVADESRSFTDAVYIVAVGGLALYSMYIRHNQRCRRRARER